MKNIHKNFYVISFLLALVLLGTYIHLNQTDSEENINVSENNTEIEKIISQKAEQTSDNPKIEEDQNNLPETDKIEESQPKEIRIVAEEILYPDEYDFGEITYDMVFKIGKPIKFNALPITKVQVGDIIEFEFGGMNFESTVKSHEEDYYTADQTDENLGSVTSFWFDAIIDTDLNTTFKNSVKGQVTYNNNGVIGGKISIRGEEKNYNIHLSNDVAYYLDNDEKIREEANRGYKLD